MSTMDRKYQRVEIGAGAIHNPPRAQYSEETRNLVKLLMEESKLTMMQRKSIQEAVDRGDSLPPANDRPSTHRKKYGQPQTLYSSFWKRRPQDVIINSGVYEREQYRRTSPLPDKEKQKRHLACMMAYGKEMPETPHGPKILHRARRTPKLPENVDPMDELIQGIRERMEFLNDMENLGMGKKYRPIIQQEIAQKIRLIESLDKQKSKILGEEIREFKYERPPPKPLPLGEWDQVW